MSVWTHVAGVIRFDGISGMMPEPDLGTTVDYDDPQEKWDSCNVPCGSEGSLEYTLRTNPMDSHLARWVATVFGDLRDYEDEQEIIDYFGRIVKGRMVRQGMFSFNVEGRDPRVFIFDDENWKEITC